MKKILITVIVMTLLAAAAFMLGQLNARQPDRYCEGYSVAINYANSLNSHLWINPECP